MSDFPKTVKELPADEQPRERALKHGVETLTTAELWCIILRTGTQGYPITDLCRDMMEQNGGSLLRLQRRKYKEILSIRGLGSLKALQVMAVTELTRRYHDECLAQENVRKAGIRCAKDIYEEMRHDIANLDHEEIWVIMLNRSNRIICKRRITVGGTTSSVFDVKRIMKEAIVELAEGLVLCHNHPSGNRNPSLQDDNITQAMKRACEALDIRLLDHLIVTTDGFYSYMDNGKL